MRPYAVNCAYRAHVSPSIFIDSTLIVGAFAADGFTAFALGGLASVADGSRVPVISTW